MRGRVKDEEKGASNEGENEAERKGSGSPRGGEGEWPRLYNELGGQDQVAKYPLHQGGKNKKRRRDKCIESPKIITNI